jgi:hypothetical protein
MPASARPAAEANAAGLKKKEVQQEKSDEDADMAATLEKMRVFYSRFNPAKVGQVNNSKKAHVRMSDADHLRTFTNLIVLALPWACCDSVAGAYCCI